MKTLQKKKIRQLNLSLIWTIALIIISGSSAAANTNLYSDTKIDNIGDTQNRLVAIQQINPTTVELIYQNNQRLTVDFYGNNIFRLFQDNNGGILRDPQAKPEAQILVDNPRKQVDELKINTTPQKISISTSQIKLEFDRLTSLMQVSRLDDMTIVLEQTGPIIFNQKNTTIKLKEQANEYFYGGGVQNGRFSHKGKRIAIENQNSWTDGGVASPTPFYWSTSGYGMMWYTFKKGSYDFGAKEKGVVELQHDTDYLDLFFMINQKPTSLLNDFYQLTGNPILIPKFGFYQGHLNAYNRDYWKESEDKKGILFEDGKYYTENQKDNGGIKESLNGEKNNYQFSARAVIDRYKKHDMPFGWLLPNDGYGAGYGQTETLDGNIQNLKELTEYAHKNGVEIGLWTQSDLHPKEEISALLQRDIIKEVRDAGVRVLKTDVAWVGAGYSFGLNGIADVSQIMTYYGNNSRPFIISLDGWAGTQRYAGVWSGDQSGGNWEYIRFHIPTYLGSGLSGQPNISSDMDGIFGGKNPIVNARDFQWKTFTPTQLNMDGWGSNEKYPHAMGEPTTSINRFYLKLKSEIMPYAYSIAKEAVDGKPMIRAMFLDYPNAYTMGKSTEYQFLYGPNFLVAPIYQETKADSLGNDIRNGIYLPEGRWIDYFTGESYQGNSIINNFDAPIWKLPVFVKSGAIIPMVNPNNNVSEIDDQHRIFEIYPDKSSSFTVYDDDGVSELYKQGQGVTTQIESTLDTKQNLSINIEPSKGDFKNFNKDKSTELRINVSQEAQKVMAKVGGKKVKLTKVQNKAELDSSINSYFYDEKVNMNRFSTPGSSFKEVEIIKNPQLIIKLAKTDISQDKIEVSVSKCIFETTNGFLQEVGQLETPFNIEQDELNTAYSLTPTWKPLSKADFYEIEFDNMLYTTIKDTLLQFNNLTPQTDYSFRLRGVNKEGASSWSSFNLATKNNPLEFAIPNIKAKTSVKNQGGADIDLLFDFDQVSSWHTTWKGHGYPFEIVMDLQTINTLDKIHYLPRSGAGNGTLLEGTLYYSLDKDNWTKIEDFSWERNDKTKIINIKEQPTARYLKLVIKNGVGGFGSGRELYVFKVPNTESYIPGDINNDRLINRNDFTSYTNYTGLRLGDADFEGYISKGDLNKNNLIDAYDISVVATQLDGGINKFSTDSLSGTLELKLNQSSLKSGQEVEVVIKGKDLKGVNGLSFALNYNQNELEFIAVKPINMLSMENLTNDRLHTNGNKALYPTFINVGQKKTLQGDTDLFVLKFKAKKDAKLNLKIEDGFLVDQKLKVIRF